MVFPNLPSGNGGEVVRQIEAWKDGLLRAEAAQMRTMAAEWLRMERRLDALFTVLAAEVKALADAGEAVSISQLAQLSRYRELLTQTREEIGNYADYAGDLVGERQLELGNLGVQHAQEALVKSGVVRGRFEQLPVRAVEAMVGVARDGTPLGSLLRRSWPEAVDGLTQALVEAVTLGKNPRETARMMRDGFGVGLNRALTIARTEQLRVYRESSRMQYQASGVVIGYRRIAAKQDRTCMACLLADGQFYRTEEAFEEHPNGRCTLVPVVRGMPEVRWVDGRQWFEGQDEATQRRMMGPSLYEAWQSGSIGLDDVVRREVDAEWGAYLRPVRVGEV